MLQRSNMSALISKTVLQLFWIEIELGLSAGRELLTILCSAGATIPSAQKNIVIGFKHELILFHDCLGLIFDDGFQNVQSFHEPSPGVPGWLLCLTKI